MKSTKANEVLKQCVVPRIMVQTDLDKKNEALCSRVYFVFGSSFGTKPSCFKALAKSHRKQHNRVLKRLRKQKLRAQRALRAAQCECRCVVDQRRLGLEYRQVVRKYHTAFKKSNKSMSRVDISRVRKECAQSFWKFVSKVLDGDQTSSNSKFSFDSSSAQADKRVYSSLPRSFDTPS